MKAYAKAFYKSRAWKDCRRSYLQSKNYICERCGDIAKIVHHKKYISPQNIDNPMVTLNWDNLEAICQECHNKEHNAIGAVCIEGIRFDENGDLVKE